MATKESQIDTTTVQCDNCGGGLFFDPKTAGLKCKNCNSLFPFSKQRDLLKNDFVDSSIQNRNWSQESRVFHCDSCGAEIIVTGYDVTTVCPYCGNGYVSKVDKLPGLKPDKVVPFKLDETQAQELFQKGVKKHFFAPSVIKKKIPESKIRGLLIPSFLFDSNTISSYDGVLEKVTTTTDSKGRVQRNVRRFSIKGTKKLSFNDIVVESSSKFEQSQVNSLLPYNLNESYHFDYNFLRGYFVEHYQDSLDVCFSKAKVAMDSKIKSSILSEYNYTNVVKLDINTSYLDRKYSYTLLPVYTIEYEYKKKKVINIMNGQTGRIGKGLPVSPLKVSLTVISGIIIIVLLFILIFACN